MAPSSWLPDMQAARLQMHARYWATIIVPMMQLSHCCSKLSLSSQPHCKTALPKHTKYCWAWLLTNTVLDFLYIEWLTIWTEHCLPCSCCSLNMNSVAIFSILRTGKFFMQATDSFYAWQSENGKLPQSGNPRRYKPCRNLKIHLYDSRDQKIWNKRSAGDCCRTSVRWSKVENKPWDCSQPLV